MISLDIILSKLPQFLHLSYLSIQWAVIQSSNIINQIFQIRSLKHLILYSPDPIVTSFNDNSIDPFTELEYLDMSSCCITDLFEMLKYVGPNVKKMRIRIGYVSDQKRALLNSAFIDELLLNQNIPGIIFKDYLLCSNHRL